jgi:hypothetical protein
VWSDQSQSRITTDSQSVSLSWCQARGARDQFFFLLEMFLRQLRVCYFVAPSLTRGRVCNLLLLLVLASIIPRDSRPYFIVPILETPQTWRARSPYLYPTGTGWPSYTPGPCVPFRRPLRLAGLRWRYSNPPPHGNELTQFDLYCYRRSVGQFVLVSCPFWSG